ncbi:Ldh family oxidoreductase [Paracoccus pantotrophus]|uniref:Ldh family oxidoreductase n=1 Tax=Paracoccus pantotrophus TaxID=82367 RepID=A0A7H9BT20_PARPN|nr:Ldh family oxidoreductase [Paracoccus pantotrophus]QLH13001.1 Ldh family oxidoreductase [Paracoccus pantotrophus]
MYLSFADARQLAIDVLSSHGMPSDHAAIVADHLVDAAGAGHAFAGLPRVMALVEHLTDHPAGKEITVTDVSPSSATIDGAGNNGYVTSLIGIDKAIELARQSGVGVVGIRNTWFSGRLAYYVERAARAGFIALHTASTQARVAPSGGIDRIFGTNPVAFAFPCEPDPLVIDFGTGMTTWGNVLLRRKLEQPLDPDSAVDVEGNPTTDPSAALEGAFLPWGGHRGYGLALVVQVLAILAGGKMVAEEVTDSGFFFLVIDPALLGNAGDFRRQVGELVAHIEGSRPAPGNQRVRVPGRGSLAKRAKAEAAGQIEVDQAVYDTLVALRNGPVGVK